MNHSETELLHKGRLQYTKLNTISMLKEEKNFNNFTQKRKQQEPAQFILIEFPKTTFIEHYSK